MTQGLFELDKQTLDDLAIFPNGQNGNSLFNLFNKTKTIGGADKLEQIFNKPLCDSREISTRIAAIKYFQDHGSYFIADRSTCDFVEFYLKQKSKPRAFFKVFAVLEKIIYAFNSNNDYYVIHQGIINTLKIISLLDEFTLNNEFNMLPEGLRSLHIAVTEILNEPDFVYIKGLGDAGKLKAFDIAFADHLFREAGYDKVKILLEVVYQLDVYSTVAAAGRSLGYTLPVVDAKSGSLLVMKELFHPFVDKPVRNSIEFDQAKNVCFVTGANMAGKSTFLKSVGISIYLSQLGFPVPAAFMKTSTFSGLITTINLSDNIFQGNSHFYAEVLRVKYVAQKLTEKQDIVVLFDELFRGTNVKDAFDASLAIINAFAKLRNSFFVISTHIVEVANELSGIVNINFKFMKTTFTDGIPQYNYRLEDGITEERLGMWVVKNEGIVEIIEGIIEENDKLA